MIAREPSKPRATWPAVSQLLRRYQYEWAIAERVGLGHCPGAYLAISLVVLIVVGAATRLAESGAYSGWLALAWVAAAIYIADALLVHTSIAFVTRRPDYPLRSALLTLVAFVNVVNAFALIYVVHGHRFTHDDGFALTYPRSFVYSVFTATTFGDTFTPGDDPFALCWTAAQLLITLYFLAVIVAIVVNWSGSEGEEGR